MIKLIDPLKIDESEFNDFINEFKAAKEDLVPYSLNQKDMDFQAYVKSLLTWLVDWRNRRHR